MFKQALTYNEEDQRRGPKHGQETEIIKTVKLRSVYE